MPIVIVYGIPTSTTHLAKLRKSIQGAVTAVDELDLKMVQVSTHFPQDLLDPDRALISVLVHGLFDKVERTDEVRQRVAEGLARAIRAFAAMHIPSWDLIEILMDPPFDSRHGFVAVTP